MKNFTSTGDIVEVTAPANVSSGDIVAVGGLIGIATGDALSSARVNIKTTGVFELAKTSAQAWATVGLAIYRDNSTGLATSVAAGNKLIGVNLAVAANPSASGTVLLSQPFSLSSAAQVTAEIGA
ncbi:DUF2190 family protein [Hoeflea sp. G2-23]|uniref:DUF2190 family protein n=1 Tax=Hoeflea algicola TaxID=2983763 RepID=A0ABT3ZDH4_9HYPH|nr:capsid cement protein [Hoeflea algicola]MCY0149855.1 DUF2190 family protein [Hoeflea algicola]